MSHSSHPIIDEHAELAGLRKDVLETVTEAERVLSGTSDKLFAVRMVETE